MKLRIQSLLLVGALSAAVFSCKDDDDDKKLSNAFAFDGKKTAIKTAYFDDNTSEVGGGYDLYFSSLAEDEMTEESLEEYVWIEIPKEMMGTKFPLTEEKLYQWGWWIEYSNDETELYYTGFGAEGDMEDVESGTIYAVDKGDGAFAAEVNVVFTDGKTLKLNFSGKRTNGEDDEPARKKLRADNSPKKKK
jgi:hypothetical protein